MYGDLARRLHEDLGLAPGGRVRALQQQILRHDESLALAPRSSAAWRTPLERPADQLVGRETLLLRLESELGGDRVHTLVGPSGVGKTRIATELAARCQAAYPDGAVLVALEGVCGTDTILGRVADALSRPCRGPVRAQRGGVRGRRGTSPGDPRQPRDDAGRPWPARRRGCAAGRSTFVVTSARPSGLQGERVWSVPALDDDAAAELLLVRARHAGADLPDDAESRGRALECAAPGRPAPAGHRARRALGGVRSR